MKNHPKNCRHKIISQCYTIVSLLAVNLNSKIGNWHTKISIAMPTNDSDKNVYWQNWLKKLIIDDLHVAGLNFESLNIFEYIPELMAFSVYKPILT